MNSLESLQVNDPIVVVTHSERVHRCTVAKVARVWLTVDRGEKFLIKDGTGAGDFGGHAYTEADYAALQETKRLRVKLVSWGWVPSTHGKRLTLDQMRRAAALIDEFEAEAAS